MYVQSYTYWYYYYAGITYGSSFFSGSDINVFGSFDASGQIFNGRFGLSVILEHVSVINSYVFFFYFPDHGYSINNQLVGVRFREPVAWSISYIGDSFRAQNYGKLLLFTLKMSMFQVFMGKKLVL